jgi:hypothetical protein
MKTTPWFNEKEMPVRTGVYIADWPEEAKDYVVWFAYWDGSQWGFMRESVDEAVMDYQKNPSNRHMAGLLIWRGLLKESK